MTTLLEQALEAARRLPAAAQDAIAPGCSPLPGANEEASVLLTPEEKSALGASKTAVAQREYVTDEEVRAVSAKHDL